jgi:type III pantothenate kinase
MILEMDFGNTRIKWRIRNDVGVVLRGAVDYEDGLPKIKSAIGDIARISVIWIASVLDPNSNDEIKCWLESNFNLTPQYCESSLHASGVVNGYGNPHSLGVDRWLAIVAAYNLYHCTCVVISAGTAITVDLVDQKGKHLGGYIVPGWSAALRTLNQNAKLIKLDEIKSVQLSPGVNTQSAVDHGLAVAYKGLIEGARAHLVGNQGGEAALIATGGDSWRIKEFFPDVLVNDELVLDGLAFCMFKT